MVSGEEFERAFAEMRARNAEALLVPGSIRFSVNEHRIIALAQRYRLPTIYEFLDWVDEGGLIAYGPDYQKGYRRVAHYIVASCVAHHPAICQSRRRCATSWSSTCRPPARSASRFHKPCCFAPTE